MGVIFFIFHHWCNSRRVEVSAEENLLFVKQSQVWSWVNLQLFIFLSTPILKWHIAEHATDDSLHRAPLKDPMRTRNKVQPDSARKTAQQ